MRVHIDAPIKNAMILSGIGYQDGIKLMLDTMTPQRKAAVCRVITDMADESLEK